MTHRWLTGVRRHHVTSGLVARLADSDELNGIVWLPAAFRPSDVSGPLHLLTDAGAKPDFSLLWDLSVEVLREAARESDTMVVVWMDPDSLSDPKRAAQAALAMDADLDVDNFAVGFAFSGARAGALTSILAEGIPVALSAVKDAEAVARSRDKAIERLRKEEGEDAAEPEVYVLDGAGSESTEAVECFAVPDAAVRLPQTPEDERQAVASALRNLATEAGKPWPVLELTDKLFDRAVRKEMNELGDFWTRLWERDHTLWASDPSEISDRLGWLDVTEKMRSEVPKLRDLDARARNLGIETVILAGMGGSSLGVELLASVMPSTRRLVVLDTTNPDAVESRLAAVDLSRAMVVVASKSGSTAETRAHAEILWGRMGDPARFVVVTDPGSALASLAGERGWACFENPPDIGGRYSALSMFGLVGAALCGVDVGSIVTRTNAELGSNPSFAPTLTVFGAWIGAAVAEAATSGEAADKVLIRMPKGFETFGAWLEQLIAESLGKDGRGVIPVVDPFVEPAPLDSFVIEYATEASGFSETGEHSPAMRVKFAGAEDIPVHMWHWMVAVACAGHILEIHPFDQPDVESAKQKARESLESPSSSPPDPGDLSAAVESAAPDAYYAIQAWVPDTSVDAVNAAAKLLAAKTGREVTVGTGPRYLHSTGQAHKGGIDAVVAVQVWEKPETDIEIPGGGSLAALYAAQADGDLVATREAGRTAVRVSMAELQEFVT